MYTLPARKTCQCIAGRRRRCREYSNRRLVQHGYVQETNTTCASRAESPRTDNVNGSRSFHATHSPTAADIDENNLDNDKIHEVGTTSLTSGWAGLGLGASSSQLAVLHLRQFVWRCMMVSTLTLTRVAKRMLAASARRDGHSPERS